MADLLATTAGAYLHTRHTTCNIQSRRIRDFYRLGTFVLFTCMQFATDHCSGPGIAVSPMYVCVSGMHTTRT